ncbi:MAG: nucleotidyltransferase family protein [Gammaproteobacteria bacterium]|nr:nucleotidyltransferase family protein [Gammaproteobacteria bacterium]
MFRVVGVLLAAGNSLRFGSDKLMYPLEEGSSVAISAAQNLITAVPESVAIIKPGQQELAASFISLGLKVIENPRAEEGMGTSLAEGIKAKKDADGWLIALADMPWIKPKTILDLADELKKGATIVAPRYDQKRGHPVGFASDWRDKLLSLHGDEGARHLLNDHPDALKLMDTNDPGVVSDIDVPADLSR